MAQFHKPGNEKRSIVVIPPEQRQTWLSCDINQAAELLLPMPDEFTAEAQPRTPKPLA